MTSVRLFNGSISVGIDWLPRKPTNTPFSITTRHTVGNAELFYSDNCYTLFNDNTPHSEQL